MSTNFLDKFKKHSLYSIIRCIPKLFLILKMYTIKNKRVFKTCMLARRNLLNLHDTQLLKLIGHTDWIKALCFSQSGNLLATGSWDKKIIIYSLSPLDEHFGKEIIKLSCHTNYVNCLYFSQCENFLASASKDMTSIISHINMKQRETLGKEYLKLLGHNNDITSICYSPCSNYIATGSCDRTVLIYGVNRFNRETFGHILTKLTGHIDSILTIAYSPDGNYIASGGKDCNTIIHKINKSDLLHILDLQHKPELNQSQDITDGNTHERYILGEHTNTIHSVNFSNCGGYFATGSADRTAIIYGANPNLKLNFCKPILKIVNQHKDWVLSIAFSSNVKYFATGGADKKAIIYRFNVLESLYYQDCIIATDKVLSHENHKDRIFSVAFSPCSNYFATASDDKSVIVYC